MRCVVTGGAGFIGSHMCELLVDEGYDVIVLDNLSTGRIQNITHLEGRVSFVECDLSKANDNWVEEVASADYVFHLASLADIVPSIKHPEAYFEANVKSTLNILQACNTQRLAKLVYAGSSSCYGISECVPTDEKAKIDPRYPYALTKYMGEELVMHWNRVYGLKTVSTRFFNVYGTRSRTSGTYGAVMGVFLAQKLAGKDFTVVGDGNQLRDFTYVTDICRGLLKAARSVYAGEVFNLGSGEPRSINDLVRILGGGICYIPKRPGEPDITHADISKAVELLEYNPEVSFEEGIQKLLENIEYWREAPVWDADSIAVETKEWFDNLSQEC